MTGNKWLTKGKKKFYGVGRLFEGECRVF